MEEDETTAGTAKVHVSEKQIIMMMADRHGLQKPGTSDTELAAGPTADFAPGTSAD